MKKSLIVLGLLFGTVTTPVTFAGSADSVASPALATVETVSTDKNIIAGSGCCKTRKSTDSPWRKTHTDFDKCKKQNEDEKDNVFKPTGKVWWDAAC